MNVFRKKAQPLLVLVALAGLAGQASAEVFCPIEIGGGGVKARVFDIGVDAQCNLKVDELFSVDENPNLVQSMQQNRFSPDAIANTANIVERLHGQMNSTYPGCLALTVGSSGVATAANTEDLKQAIVAKGMKDMSFITPDQEAAYGFRSSIPPQRRAQAVLVDVGSGNTKIGYRDKAGEFRSMSIPFGSSSLAKRAEATGLPLRFGVAKTVMTEILPKFRDDAKANPEVLKRDLVYWIGGAAWATATYTHPEQIEKSVVTLTRSDIEEFLIALEKDTWKSRTAPAGLSDKALAAWQKDWTSVQKIFLRERLLAGVSLMKVILSDGVYRDTVTFPRYGQWLFGYSVELFKIASPMTCNNK